MINIRNAEITDAERLVEIYGYYVKNTAITFAVSYTHLDVYKRQIHKLAKHKTVLLISHRLANVIQSDNIYVLENGRIAESGSHTELLQNHGLYERLWNCLLYTSTSSEAEQDSSTGNPVVWWVIGGIIVVAIAGGCVWYFCFFRKGKNPFLKK